MTLYEEIAAILHPMPGPGQVPDDVLDDVRTQVEDARERAAFGLEAAWDDRRDDTEPLLAAIAAARRQKEEAEADIRRLVAYGREFVRPRPYRLADLAEAAGMSISGVRTAYAHGEVADVEQAISRAPREWRNATPDDPIKDGGTA